MPTIEFNRKLIEKISGKKLSDKDLKEKITMFGTPVEGLTSNELKVEIFPNRPDLLSERGYGRAFASFLGTKKGLKQYKATDSKQKVIVDESVKSVRPFTACAIVKGLNFNDEKIKEVIKIQEKLHVTYGRNRKRCAIGVYPLDKISFPVRYLAKKPNEIMFTPLESKKRMSGAQILEQHPTGKEYKHLLAGQSMYPIFLDNHGKVLSMPPIINSHDVGKVDVGTNNVFVECTGFDQEVLNKCLDMIVSALADMGGKIENVEVNYKGKKLKTPMLETEKMKVDVSYVNKRLGLNLKDKDVSLLLSKMGLGYANKQAIIPCYRADILHQIDLVEDIAIAYGYNNFVEEIPKVSTIAKQDGFEKFKTKVANILVGMNIDEMNSTNITNKELETTMMLVDKKPIMLYNSLNAEYNSLRSSTIPGLMLALQQNKINEYPQNIFEIGTTFKWGVSETGIEENTHLGLLLCHRTAGYTEIKQKLERLLKLLGVSSTVKITENPSFVPGRVSKAIVNGKEIAYLGEVHPEVISNFELEMPVSALELDLGVLFEIINKA